VIGNHDTGNLGPIIEVAPPAARQILIEARYPGKQAEGPLRVDERTRSRGREQLSESVCFDRVMRGSA